MSEHIFVKLWKIYLARHYAISITILTLFYLFFFNFSALFTRFTSWCTRPRFTCFQLWHRKFWTEFCNKIIQEFRFRFRLIVNLEQFFLINLYSQEILKLLFWHHLIFPRTARCFHRRARILLLWHNYCRTWILVHQKFLSELLQVHSFIGIIQVLSDIVEIISGIIHYFLLGRHDRSHLIIVKFVPIRLILAISDVVSIIQVSEVTAGGDEVVQNLLRTLTLLAGNVRCKV